MKVVVCDDDVTLRSVVSRLAEGAGHEVMAETDSAADAVDLVTRFGADLLVLDLSLPWGSGMAAINLLRDMGSPCQVVVFTAYAEDSPDVRKAQVRAVIEKPDFEALEQVMHELATGRAGLPVASERRRPWRERPHVPAASAATPSGIESPESFKRVLEVIEEGDAVLVVHVAGIDEPPGEWGALWRADCFLSVARALRTVLRTQDRMTVESEQLAALLLDGERVGAQSAFRRLEQHLDASSLPGVVSGGWAVHDGVVSPYSTFTRAHGAALRSIGQPPGDRLWAG